MARVSSIKELEKIITKKILTPTFEEIADKHNSKWNGFFKVLGKASNKFTEKKWGVNFVDVGLNYGIELHDYKDDVICFDDLERSTINIKELIGYIGDFIESKSVKVVVLVNEKNISIENDDNQKAFDSYENLKEKIASLTINFPANISDAFESVIKADKFHHSIKQHKEHIVSLFEILDIKNIRTLIVYFGVLSKIFNNFDLKYEKQLKNILSYCLFVLNAHKNGKMPCCDLEILKGLSNSLYTLNEREIQLRMLQPKNLDDNKIEEDDDNINDILYKQYFKKLIENNKFQLIDYISLGQYILTGYFNSELFNKELVDNDFQENPTINAYYAIVNPKGFYAEYSDEDFNKHIENAEKYLKENSYSIYQVYSLASWFMLFAKWRLTDKTENEVTKEFCIYINNAISISTFNEAQYSDSKFRTEEMKEFFIAIDKALDEAHEKLRIKGNEDNCTTLADLLENDFKSVNELMRFFSTKEHSPFFQSMESDEFIELLKTCSNGKSYKLYNFLKNRYEHIGSIKKLQVEKDFISEVSTSLNSEVEKINEKEKISIKELHIQWFKKLFEEIKIEE